MQERQVKNKRKTASIINHFNPLTTCAVVNIWSNNDKNYSFRSKSQKSIILLMISTTSSSGRATYGLFVHFIGMSIKRKRASGSFFWKEPLALDVTGGGAGRQFLQQIISRSSRKNGHLIGWCSTTLCTFRPLLCTSCRPSRHGASRGI